jgi:hypothetical protein
VRAAVACVLVALGAVGLACSDLRAAEEGPSSSRFPDAATRITDSGGDAGNEGNALDGGSLEPGATRDLEQAMWPLPAASPASADYAVTEVKVLDERTRLVWQRVAEAAPATLEEARAICDVRTAGGDDWRLPTRIELLSLVDYGEHDPALAPVPFAPATEGGTYWTTSVDAKAPAARAWAVSFALGTTRTEGVATKQRVRCVRSLPAPSPRWALGPDTAKDLRTGLTWQRRLLSLAKTFDGALVGCQSAATGGLSGWRVPNARELESLVDVRAAVAPTWDTAVLGSEDPGALTWSATSLAADRTRAVVVDFAPEHATTSLPIGASAGVRCVTGP